MSGVAETFGAVPAGSACEHVAKITQQISKVPISLCHSLLPLRRLQFTWGSAFFTRFPSFISEIHSKTAPPCLPTFRPITHQQYSQPFSSGRDKTLSLGKESSAAVCACSSVLLAAFSRRESFFSFSLEDGTEGLSWQLLVLLCYPAVIILKILCTFQNIYITLLLYTTRLISQ